MNPVQMAQQIKYRLETLIWTGGDPVFGDVAVTSMPIRELARRGRRPIAAIRMNGDTRDGEFPEIVSDARFGVEVLVSVPNDQNNEASHIGGVRLALTTSRGRGIGEIAGRIASTLNRNDPETGFFIKSQTSGSASTLMVDGEYYATQMLNLAAKGMSEPHYPDGYSFTTSGNVMTWTNPSPRFDHHAAVSIPARAQRGKMVLRFASGSTAPATATSGTGATLASDFAATYTHAAGAGTFSYALFVEYDFVGSGASAVLVHSDSLPLTAVFT